MGVASTPAGRGGGPAGAGTCEPQARPGEPARPSGPGAETASWVLHPTSLREVLGQQRKLISLRKTWQPWRTLTAPGGGLTSSESPGRGLGLPLAERSAQVAVWKMTLGSASPQLTEGVGSNSRACATGLHAFPRLHLLAVPGRL